MRHSAKLKKYDAKSKQAIITFDTDLNTERLRTMYNGDISEIYADVTFHDPRRFNTKQRALYRALLNDIYAWSGENTDMLHEWFKEEYMIKYFKPISTADNSKSTISDLNQLIEIVIEFMFVWNVPFKKGYELLPTNENYYLYQCIKHRKCAVCGSHSDIHHVDAVGNQKRSTVDHRELKVISICRKHHNEAHNLGNTEFLKRYKLRGIKVDGDTLFKLGIMTKKQIEEIDSNER